MKEYLSVYIFIFQRFAKFIKVQKQMGLINLRTGKDSWILNYISYRVVENLLSDLTKANYPNAKNRKNKTMDTIITW